MKFLYYSFSYLLGLIFLLAGIEKFTGLPDIIGPHLLIPEMEKYHLKLFAEFISISELIVGMLLFTNKLKTLGSVMLFPLLSSILVVTISLEWQGTPIVNSILLSMNIYMLYFDRAKFMQILFIDKKNNNIIVDWIYLIACLVILIGVAIFYFDINRSTGKLICKIGIFALICTAIWDRGSTFFGSFRKNTNI